MHFSNVFLLLFFVSFSIRNISETLQCVFCSRPPVFFFCFTWLMLAKHSHLRSYEKTKISHGMRSGAWETFIRLFLAKNCWMFGQHMSYCHEEFLHCYTTFLVIFSACSQFTQQFQIKMLIHHLSWGNELLVHDPIHIKEINQHGFIVNNLVSHTFMDLGEFSSFHWFDNDFISGP